jgi:hypothetical protein
MKKNLNKGSNMKWFKHVSDSLDDPFIFDLINRFGGDGYLVFFGVLEIYSREFKPELNWNLTITQSYLKQKLQKRQSTLITKILKHIKNSGKWEVELNESQITIFIPKFQEIIDEWTGRKLRSTSVATPKILRTEEEVRSKKKNIPHCGANAGETFLEYALKKSHELNLFVFYKKISEFINYRMSKPKKQIYNSEKGVNGLFRDLVDCKAKGYNIETCMDIAMENNWLSPKPSYFEKNPPTTKRTIKVPVHFSTFERQDES